MGRYHYEKRKGYIPSGLTCRLPLEVLRLLVTYQPEKVIEAPVASNRGDPDYIDFSNIDMSDIEFSDRELSDMGLNE